MRTIFIDPDAKGPSDIYIHTQATGDSFSTAEQCDSIANQFGDSLIVVCSIGIGYGFYV